MARAFAGIAFNPSVRDVQERMGSRAAYAYADEGDAEVVQLGPGEIDFIGARDSFYQATVGQNGWPYVQHRGGPPGFLKVLAPDTIGYADFSGNRQYISVGNLVADDRVSLILMDYPAQRRLKIWGRARLVDEDEEPALVARLESSGYRARVERGVLIQVEAFDWNCPKYITPRFTEAELALRTRPAALDPKPAQLPELTNVVATTTGNGPVKLAITAVRALTDRVMGFELSAVDGGDLPAVTAGAHLSVPVILPDGSTVTRQYSIASDPRRRDLYEIAVQREDRGRGGSDAIHATWGIGTKLAVEAPINHFPLHDDARPAVLIAGGIGITPVRSMAFELAHRDRDFQLHYLGRQPSRMPFLRTLETEFPSRVHRHVTGPPDGRRPDLASVLRAAPDSAVFYVCGPSSLIEGVISAAREADIAPDRIQYESFE